MRYEGDKYLIIKDLFDISKNIDSLIDDNKKQQEADKGAFSSDYEKNKYHYINLSYIKMVCLFNSSLILTSKKYPDEARIILRSMFELMITFKYIFLGDESLQVEKLKRYFDYIKLVAPFLTPYKTKNIYCNSESSIKNHSEICEFVFEEFKKFDIEDKIKKFKLKYQIKQNKQLNTWHGKTFDDVFQKVDLGQNVKKIYSWYCNYTHNVIMNYHNGNEYNDEPTEEEIIEALFVLNTLFGFFICDYYFLRQFKRNLLEETYLKPFFEILDKYKIGM